MHLRLLTGSARATRKLLWKTIVVVANMPHSMLLNKHVPDRSGLLKSESLGGDTVLKNLWQHQDAILCCSFKTFLEK
ncbi:hypothetical protein V6N13_139258 [Hibiscus sabdariffa]|uniref:Uncharacterized protein n=1 Tax=Hibiscus sabdariffa TaxID=183260 RepID=A0ABR2CAJ9_9ROSI